MSDSSVIRPVAPEHPDVTPAVTLDAFLAATAGSGVVLQQLEPLTGLVVETRNTRYRIVTSHGTEVIIQGGTFFPDPTRVHLNGASLGGSLLKVGWIGLGFRMEIVTGGQRIVTTAVRAIERERRDQGRPH
jgi:hypothetical protein